MLLHVGCGTSLLGLQLHRAGYKDVVNVDYVSAVTEQMAAQYGAPGITWEACDLTAPTRWAPASFDVVRRHRRPWLIFIFTWTSHVGHVIWQAENREQWSLRKARLKL